MRDIAVVKNNWQVIVTDAVVLVLVYFIPALAHVSPFPLYYLDPMRFLLFGAYLISRNQNNAFILALTIPLFSCLIAHHPPFYKALLISIELVINIACFQWMIKKVKWQPGIVIFIATIVSKLFYYLFKYVFLQFGLVEGGLITTAIDTQLYTIAGLSLLYAVFYKRRQV